MEVKLIAYTQLTPAFAYTFPNEGWLDEVTNGRAVALTAIRSCYSHRKPTEIVKEEGEKYFGKEASDGEGGTDADRLFRHIVRSGHTSTLEHLAFTFAVEGISRSCLAQLTRHRIGFSYSVQSQRYVRFGKKDKSGGFNHVMPPSIADNPRAAIIYSFAMGVMQQLYDELRDEGVPPEDARMILPQGATTNLVLSANLRAILDFYQKRRKGKGAQWEIAELAERIREEVVKYEPWVDPFFEGVGKGAEN